LADDDDDDGLLLSKKTPLLTYVAPATCILARMYTASIGTFASRSSPTATLVISPLGNFIR
jgi:hypothetical protein